MAFIWADRVKETTTTTGTGNFALAGAVTGYQAFGDVMSNGDTTKVTVWNGSGEWETVEVTYDSSGNSLSRDRVIDSSAGGSAVNFSSGTKDVFMAMTSEEAESLIGLQVFTSNGTYTPTTGTKDVLVICTAGGGGGGYAVGGTDAAAGAGGGAGGTSIERLTSGFSSVSVTVGTGGSGGVGSSATGATGGNSSSFGSALSATGGSAGANSGNQSATTIVQGGSGGIGSDGDVNLRGGGGGPGINIAGSDAVSGVGGASYWGGGGPGIVNGSALSADTDNNYGAGGAGGSTTTASDRNGGDGADGIVVVYEYG